ncbi:hypothetical protein T484DRAFT_1851139 [Baffinella frigidus]|nr:hypothetical protein T484DRAFT_1851139 [Cryptophyta sp. CCMP2293]
MASTSSGEEPSLRRTLVRLMQQELKRAPDSPPGFVIAKILSMLRHDETSVHKDISQRRIVAALGEMTKDSATPPWITMTGKKYKLTGNAPPLLQAQPPAAPPIPETPGDDLVVLPMGTPDEPQDDQENLSLAAPPSPKTSIGNSVDVAEPTSEPSSPALTKAQLRINERHRVLAITTSDMFTSAESMSAQHNGTFLQKESTRKATSIILRFLPDLRHALETESLSLDQISMLDEARTAINNTLCQLILAGIDAGLLKACPFCHTSRLAMIQGDPELRGSNFLEHLWPRHTRICTSFIAMAASLELEVKRVGPHASEEGADYEANRIKRVSYLHFLTKQAYGYNTAAWHRSTEVLNDELLRAVERVILIQRLSVRMFHHHWIGDDPQEGADALLHQISVERLSPLDLSTAPEQSEANAFFPPEKVPPASSALQPTPDTLTDIPSASYARPLAGNASAKVPPADPTLLSEHDAPAEESTSSPAPISRTDARSEQPSPSVCIGKPVALSSACLPPQIRFSHV